MRKVRRGINDDAGLCNRGTAPAALRNDASCAAAGNQLTGGAEPYPHTFTYDAENKIKTVDGLTAYVYNGEGERVRKLVGEKLRMVYGMSGELIVEYDDESGELQKEYIYGVSGLLATIEPVTGTRSAEVAFI